jgi:transcription initiation factor IIE alpha subunit
MEYKNYEYAEFFDTSIKQKVLQFFRDNPKGTFSTTEISAKLALPQASVNRALNDLEQLGILSYVEESRYKRFSIVPEVQTEFNKVFKHLEEIRQFTLAQKKRQKKEGAEEETWRTWTESY